MLYRKTAVRKDLEQFWWFNSVLMGLLKRVLIHIAKIHKTVRNLLRLTIKGVRFVFGGVDSGNQSDRKALAKEGVRFILCSYYYLRTKRRKTLDKLFAYLEENNMKLWLDSGAFTLHNQLLNEKKVKPITVEEFASFIIEYKKYIFSFFNLDVIGDAKQSKQNMKELKRLTRMNPIPVWHCHEKDWRKSDWKALDDLVREDHELIAIGGTFFLGKNAGVKRQTIVKDELFEEVFKRYPTQNFHWLAGSAKLILKYPWFSADSTGWIQGRQKKQQIYYFGADDIETAKKPFWSKERCLHQNIKTLNRLEELYDGVQLSFADIITAS